MKNLALGIAGLALLAWFIWPKSLPPIAADVAALATHSDPHHPWQYNHYKITPLEPFQMEARVLHTKHYSSDREAQLSPVDLAIGWGRMADPEILRHFTITQSDRWYFYRYNNSPIPESEIRSSSKNVHMIPADAGVRTTLLNVREGQTVKISGYLIRADASDGWHWISNENLARTGAHSCLVVWVESLDVN